MIWLKNISKICLEEQYLLNIDTMNGYQSELSSLVYTCFGENSTGGAIKSEIMSRQKFTKELHKQVIGKFEKRRVYFSFKGNIWGVDIANMQLISKRNKRIQFFLICY